MEFLDSDQHRKEMAEMGIANITMIARAPDSPAESDEPNRSADYSQKEPNAND